MTIVYLDQCAVGNLALKEPQEWSAIRKILEDGFLSEQIVCPFPTETLLETASCGDHALRLEIEAFFSKVSAGYRFRDFGELIVDNSLALARPNFDVEPLEEINFHGWADQNSVTASLKAFHHSGRNRMSETIQKHCYPPEAKQMTVGDLFSHQAMVRSEAFCRDLDQFLQGTRSTDRFEIPWLIEGLIKRGMSDREASNLNHAVRAGAWVEIMENKIELLLSSHWHFEIIQGQRKNHTPNDEIDRWRAVVGLSHSQLFVTDKSAAALCHRVKPLQASRATRNGHRGK